MKKTSLIPQIPIGLADQVIRKKFGKQSKILSDLILSKIAAEVMLQSIDETTASKSSSYIKIQKRINNLEKVIERQIEYLQSWYEAYFNLAMQCNECSFNNEGSFCSFYGENKIPFPDPSKKDKKCAHRIQTGESKSNHPGNN